MTRLHGFQMVRWRVQGLSLTAAAIALLLAAQAHAGPYRGALFDSHAHLIADDQQHYPRHTAQPPALADGRSPPGVAGQPGGKGGPHPVHASPDARRMLLWLRQSHVDGMAAIQKRLVYRTDNRYILDSADRYPRQMSAIVGLDARQEQTSDLIRSMVSHHAIAGIRLAGGQDTAGAMDWLNSDQALKTWRVAEDTGLVVDLEINGPRGGEPFIDAIVKLAQDHPHVSVVLDHLLEPQMHQPDFGMSGAYRRLVQPNIYVKFTTITLDLCREEGIDPVALLQTAIKLFGADHVMWGSDIGTSSGTYATMVNRIIAVSGHLSPAQQKGFLHDTGRQVFSKETTREASGKDR